MQNETACSALALRITKLCEENPNAEAILRGIADLPDDDLYVVLATVNTLSESRRMDRMTQH